MYDEVGPTPRGPVFVFTMSLYKTSVLKYVKCKNILFKRKRKCILSVSLSKWFQLNRPKPEALHPGLSPAFFLESKLPRWGCDEENGAKQMTMSTQLRSFITRQSHFTVYPMPATRHWHGRVGKENTPVLGLRSVLFFKQTRMLVVYICFILPQRIVPAKCTLFMKDYI